MKQLFCEEGLCRWKELSSEKKSMVERIVEKVAWESGAKRGHAMVVKALWQKTVSMIGLLIGFFLLTSEFLPLKRTTTRKKERDSQ